MWKSWNCARNTAHSYVFIAFVLRAGEMLLNQVLFNQKHAQLLYRSITDVFITHRFQWKQLIAFFCHLSNKFCEDKCRAMLKRSRLWMENNNNFLGVYDFFLRQGYFWVRGQCCPHAIKESITHTHGSPEPCLAHSSANPENFHSGQ